MASRVGAGGIAGRAGGVGIALALALAACRPSGPPVGEMPVRWSGDIDGEAALAHVRAQVEIGPRPSGSPGIAATRVYLREALVALGLDVEEQAFREWTPQGEIEFVNLVAEIPGVHEEFVLLGSHYDTKRMAGMDFVGANDAGSSTGLLLEIARVLAAAAPLPYAVRLAFFDGEECLVEYGSRDGLHGSRHLADAWASSGELARMRAMILLDMVGDRDLTLTIPTNCDPRLARLAYEAATELGIRDVVTSLGSALLDDHVPFARRGVPVLDLIDFEFGTRPMSNDLWHTEGDALDSVSAESLRTVGRLALAILGKVMSPEFHAGPRRARRPGARMEP